VIIVDTNVVSELMRPQPDESVRRWALAQPASQLGTTAITVAEILYGIERLPSGQRRRRLLSVATEVFATFAASILPFDGDAAAHYPRIVDARVRSGRPIDGFDAQIAAICYSTGSTLATRNTKDFQQLDLDLVDPWHPG